jgi:hypothetical protein
MTTPDPSFCTTYAEPGCDMQQPFDVAVIMPTIIRPSIHEALVSIFEQSFVGRIQVLVGLDRMAGDLAAIEAACRRRPANCAVTLLYPGYSTSMRHGGVHPTWSGGAMRSALVYLANSTRVAFLDDDNWWHRDHLQSLTAAMHGFDWAYSLRWFVHPETRRPVCIDEWESVGPGRGFFDFQGGWVDPNCLIYDKLVCDPVSRWWGIPLGRDPAHRGSDRHIFRLLTQDYRGNPTNRATVYYLVNPEDDMHSFRRFWMGEAYDAPLAPVP